MNKPDFVRRRFGSLMAQTDLDPSSTLLDLQVGRTYQWYVVSSFLTHFVFHFLAHVISLEGLLHLVVAVDTVST